MTLEEFKKELEIELQALVEQERVASHGPKGTPRHLPRETGRLADELFKIQRTTDGFKIYIDTTSWQYPIWINTVGYRTAGYWELCVQRIITKIWAKYGGELS